MPCAGALRVERFRACGLSPHRDGGTDRSPAGHESDGSIRAADRQSPQLLPHEPLWRGALTASGKKFKANGNKLLGVEPTALISVVCLNSSSIHQTQRGVPMKCQTSRLFAVSAVALAVSALVATVALVASPRNAAAKPEYASATGRACGYCHVSPGGGGALKPAGKKFQAKGHKL
jgi:hypothetical protein